MPEAVSIMLWVASAHGNKGKGKEDKDENEFASREPEFSLAVEANREDVEKSVAHNDSGANASRRSRVRRIRAPEGNDRGQGSNLKWNKQSLVEEEVPASDEAQGIIDPVSCQADKATRDGHVCVHLGDRVVDEGEDERVKGIGDQETAGAALCETASDGDEEGRTDGTTSGDELDLTVAKAPMEMAHVIRVAMIKAAGVGKVGLGVLLLFCIHGCE